MATQNSMNGYLSTWPIRGVDTSIFMFTEIRGLIKGKTTIYGLNVTFDSKVTRSCDKIIDIIKLEKPHCGFDVVLVSMATIVIRPIRASLIKSAP